MQRQIHSTAGMHGQRGAILVVSLLLLLVLTILGVNSMQGTSLEESMAHATRDRNVALQSAESAIRTGEAFIENIVSTAALTGSNGLYGFTDNEPDYRLAATWDPAASPPAHVTDTAPTGSAGAQYFIKETGVVSGIQGAMNMTGYGANRGSGDVTTFRVTARGTGGATGGAEVILRTNYGRIF